MTRRLCWNMLAFDWHDVKNSVNLRISTNCTVIWYLIFAYCFLSWGDSAFLCTRIDSWKGKRIWLWKKGKAAAVLGILPSIHTMSVRIWVELLYRKQMETVASAPSAYAQHADGEVLIWKPAKIYKRSKTFESKHWEENWLHGAFCFPFDSI